MEKRRGKAKRGHVTIKSCVPPSLVPMLRAAVVPKGRSQAGHTADAAEHATARETHGGLSACIGEQSESQSLRDAECVVTKLANESSRDNTRREANGRAA